MKKVLVLGGTRFFGKQLVFKLLGEGHHVTLATRGLTKDPFGSQVQRLVIDRKEKRTLVKAFKNKRWDLVYDQSCFSSQEALDTVEALRGKVKRYIFTSSQAVYDFGTNHKEEEFDPLHYSASQDHIPETMKYKRYQEGKRTAEQVLFKDDDFDVTAIRFPIVVGEDDHTERLKFHVKRILNHWPIGIERKELRYSFISSDEAADFLFKIGASSFIGAINPGCREDLSLAGLIHKIEAFTGMQANVTNEITEDNKCVYELEGSCSINTDRAAWHGFTFSSIDQTFDPLIKYYCNQING
ncbi:NAD-dependent epimerase/dehydratase family protein [Halobacillus rhizosphaerae]|uniref:NAD-dependent epimerase/dehydratase family protein n=1 Tax=Halobacillus rhizosphaerae TaxID=3064889 RepID=UPI00398B567E